MSGGRAARLLDEEEALLFAAARLLATRRQPYLGSALLALMPRAVDGYGTFGVDDRWRLYIDPVRLRDWGAERSAGVLLHEVGHVLRDHAARGVRLGVGLSGEHRRWNVAGDLAINDDLVADGVPLPDGVVLPHRLGLPSGLLEEDYLELLRERGAADPSPSDSDSDSDGDGRGSDEPGHQAGPSAAGRGTGLSSGGERSPDPDCGSGADGRIRPWEEDDDAAGMSPLDVRQIRIRVAAEIRQRGTAPAGWQRWAEAELGSSTDWRRVLHAAVTRPRRWRAGTTDPTWQRADRGADAHPDFVFPGRHRPAFEIAVIIDTSGSVSDAEAGTALGEIAAIQRRCGVRQLWVIPCDANPGAPQRVRHPGSVTLLGGGGTDLRPAIDLLPTLRPCPDVAVVITDGHTPWPALPPVGTALVVASTDIACPVPGVANVALEIP